jgi:hypothetical protein
MAFKQQQQKKPAPKAPPARQQQPAARSTNRPEPEEQKNPIARMSTSSAPARVRQREGKAESVSKDASDNQVPFIYLLQANSPQCLKGHEKHIPGAEAGAIWLRNDPDPLISGEQGMDFQCCYFSKDWVEWLPDRGGLVGRHPDRPEDAEFVSEQGDDGTERQVWRRPNGNQVVETRYHVGLVHRVGKPPEPYTLPLTSTGHTVSKQWTTAQNKLEGGRAEWYDVIWTLHTVLKRKGSNAWYQYEVAFNRWATEEEAEEGKNLHDAFASGTKRMEDDEATVGDGGEKTEDSSVM